MSVVQQCPECGHFQPRAERLSAVPGRKGILMDLSCESCSQSWSTELRIMLARVEQRAPITASPFDSEA